MSSKTRERHELIVWGYLHRHEKRRTSLNIPEDIKNMIFMFERVCDEWNKEYSHKKIKIDEIMNTISIKNGRTRTAYGSLVAKHGIVAWRIKIISITLEQNLARSFPYVGIIENKEKILKQYQTGCYWDDDGYQFCGRFGYIRGMKIPNSSINATWYKEGDILEIILDLNEGTMRLMINDKDYGVVIAGILKKEYRLAITHSNEHEGSSVFALL